MSSNSTFLRDSWNHRITTYIGLVAYRQRFYLGEGEEIWWDAWYWDMLDMHFSTNIWNRRIEKYDQKISISYQLQEVKQQIVFPVRSLSRGTQCRDPRWRGPRKPLPATTWAPRKQLESACLLRKSHHQSLINLRNQLKGRIRLFWSETYMTDMMSENCRKQFFFNSLSPWLSDSLADKVYTLLSDHPCSLPVSPLCVSYTAVTKLNPPSVHPSALLGLQGHTLRTANFLCGEMCSKIDNSDQLSLRLGYCFEYIFRKGWALFDSDDNGCFVQLELTWTLK